MSLPYSPSIATFNGNGVATQFPFSFKVWEVSQLVVNVVSPEGIVERMPFTATLTDKGGTVTFRMNNAPLPTGWRLSVMRSMPFEQEVDLISGTRFDPQVIEDALDVATAERQQLREAVGRAIVVPPGNDNPPELLAQEIFDARDSALTSAAHAAMSEANAEAAALEAVEARDASLEIIDSASTAGLTALGELRDSSLNEMSELRVSSVNEISLLRDSSLIQIRNTGASQVTDITQKADIKLAELTALSANMETVGNSTMAAVVAEGDRQGERLRGEASTAVTQIILEGDAQAQKVVDTATPFINEARTEADRSASEADRAEIAAEKALDMTGVGLASKTNFGLAKAGSGIDVTDGILSVKFPRIVSTPTLSFVAQAGIGYSYVLSMSASTGAAESSIDYFRVFVDTEAEIRIPAVNNAATHTILVKGLDGSVGNIVVSAMDTYANPSDDKTITFIKRDVVKRAPRILQPASGDSNVALRPVLILQALQVTGLPATPAATQILISTDADFSTLVHDSGESGYTTSYTVPVELPHMSTLYIKARHEAEFYGWSDYGPTTTVTSIEKKVLPPTVISPPSASMGQSVTPTLVVSAIQSAGIIDSGINTRVQIAKDIVFTDVIFDTLDTGAYSTSITVDNNHMLSPSSTYFVRARHKGTALGWSAWSSVSSFSTLDAYVHTPSIIEPVEGSIPNTLRPSFTFSVFANTGPSDAGINTYFQVSRTAAFDSLLVDTLESGPFVQSYTPDTNLPLDTVLYCRVRYHGQLWGWSAWSEVRSFRTLNSSLEVPTIVSPIDGAVDQPLRPTITIAPPIAVAQTVDLITYSINKGETTIVTSGDIAFIADTSWTSPTDLNYNTRYDICVRLHGTTTGWTDWAIIHTTTVQVAIGTMWSPPAGATEWVFSNPTGVAEAIFEVVTIGPGGKGGKSAFLQYEEEEGKLGSDGGSGGHGGKNNIISMGGPGGSGGGGGGGAIAMGRGKIPTSVTFIFPIGKASTVSSIPGGFSGLAANAGQPGQDGQSNGTGGAGGNGNGQGGEGGWASGQVVNTSNQSEWGYGGYNGNGGAGGHGNSVAGDGNSGKMGRGGKGGDSGAPFNSVCFGVGGNGGIGGYTHWGTRTYGGDGGRGGNGHIAGGVGGRGGYGGDCYRIAPEHPETGGAGGAGGNGYTSNGTFISGSPGTQSSGNMGGNYGNGGSDPSVNNKPQPTRPYVKLISL